MTKARLQIPTRNISLTLEQDRFVDKIVKSGEYQNTSEAIRDGLRALQQKRREDALKLKALRAHVRAGFEAAERGDFVEVGDSELDDYVANLRVAEEERTR